jgi:hypothetical protein
MTQRLVLLPWEEYQELKERQSGGARVKKRQLMDKDSQVTKEIKEPVLPPPEIIRPSSRRHPAKEVSEAPAALKIPGPPGALASDWITWK